MSDVVKISQLPPATSLTGAELTPLVQLGTTCRATTDTLAQFVRSSVVSSATVISDGTANQSPAIQAAIDQVSTAGGGVVTFYGTINMAECVEMKSNVWLDFSAARIIVPGSLNRSPATVVTVGSEVITVTAAHDLFYARAATNIHVRDGYFDMAGQTDLLSGSRIFDFVGCTDYSVVGTTSRVNGALTASRYGRYYSIRKNIVYVAPLLGAATHDGIIDQWWASAYFSVTDNDLYCDDIGLWPILVTGSTSFDNDPAKCHDFIISRNKVYGARQAGIWVMGRSGTCETFVVDSNIVDGCVLGRGIVVTDSRDGAVTSNLSKNTALQAFFLSDESTLGTYGIDSVTVANNVAENANQSAQATSSGGSAIYFLGVTGTARNSSLVNNSVRGTSHTVPLYVVGSNITYIPGQEQPGSTGASVLSLIDNSKNFSTPFVPVSSLTDTTGNRGLLTGYMGLGGQTGDVDPDVSSVTRFARATSGTLPAASNAHMITISRVSGGTSAQIAVREGATLDRARIFVRQRSSGAWSAWNEFQPLLAGTTAQRPTTGLVDGLMYTDTTLGIPVWYISGGWKDSSGAPA